MPPDALKAVPETKQRRGGKFSCHLEHVGTTPSFVYLHWYCDEGVQFFGMKFLKVASQRCDVMWQRVSMVASTEKLVLHNFGMGPFDHCLFDIWLRPLLWCLRMLLGINWHQHVRNDEVRRLTKQPHLSAIVQSRRLSLFGHIARMPDETDAKQILTASPQETGRDH